MNYIRYLILLCMVCFIGSPSQAGSDFQDWVESQRSEYRDFLEKRDQDFRRYLKKGWHKFLIEEGKIQDPTPKPKDIPVAPDELEAESREIEPVFEPEPPGEDHEPVPSEPAVPVAEEPVEAPPSLEAGLITEFLGHKLSYPVGEEWEKLHLSSPNNKGVSEYWASFAGLDTGSVIDKLLLYRDALNLNGWGHLLLVNNLASALHGRSNETMLTTWGLLLKSGYDTRVGFVEEEVVLLFRPRQELFGVPYLSVKGNRYYLFSKGSHKEKAPSLYTYDFSYQGASRDLDLGMDRCPKSIHLGKSRVLKFSYQGRKYMMEVDANTRFIEYMKTMPQLGLEEYFRAMTDARFEKAIVNRLREEVRGMGPGQGVNFLLRFTQTAFEYKPDQEQFAQENYLHPEETVYYPYSDCEDRCVLFVWLVRKVLGLKSIALDYPGHVATAVALPGGAEGLYVRFNGSKYWIADPTYINSQVGMAMPEYRDVRPKIIPTW